MRILTLLLSFLLLGCHSARPVPVDIPSIVLVSVPTPELQPTLTLRVRLLDGASGRPVVGTVYWISGDMREAGDDDMHGQAISGVDLTLGAVADGWLIVTAPDYAPLAIRVSYEISTSREIDVPARLVEVVGEGA